MCRAPIESFVSELPRMNTTKVSASLPIFSKHYYTPWRLRLRRAVVTAAKLGAKLSGELPVPSLIPVDSLKTVPLVWKSVESVGRLGVIVKVLNNMKAILILRHPCGYVSSVLRGESGHKFTGHTSSSEDFGILKLLLETEQAKRRGLTLNALEQLHPVERLAWRWVLFNEKAMDDIANDTNAMVIKYEDICISPTDKSKLMFQFSGLEWDIQTEDFIRRSTSEERTGYYSVIKNPENAAHKWRKELSPDDIHRILNIVADTPPGSLYSEESSGTRAGT